MTVWLYSIVGVVFLAVLVDLLYPSGKTNIFCKSIFGVIAVVAIISPIINLNFDKIGESGYIDVSLLETLKNSKDEVNAKICYEALKCVGISEICVEISSNMEDNVYEIENVYIDASNVVLSENLEHKNMYEVILKNIVNTLKIDESKVIIYG